MSNNILSWSEVFNTNHKMYYTIHEAWLAAIEARYPYFYWNGSIFNTETRCIDPNLKVE